ncbi:MAG: hypothetical protein ABFC31_08895 [Clostridiaceae bacterium]
MHLYENRRSANRGLIAAGAIFLALILLFSVALLSASKRNAAQETELLDSAIRRAVVTCYAVEGKYPPSLDYLYKNYGVYVDESRYAVFYDVFAANVMPSLTVTAIGGGR